MPLPPPQVKLTSMGSWQTRVRDPCDAALTPSGVDVGEVAGCPCCAASKCEFQVGKFRAQTVAVHLGVNIDDENFGHEKIYLQLRQGGKPADRRSAASVASITAPSSLAAEGYSAVPQQEWGCGRSPPPIRVCCLSCVVLSREGRERK